MKKSNYNDVDDVKNVGGFGSIFLIICVVLILISLARLLSGSSNVEFTFASLLEFCSNAPSISVDWSFSAISSITADWGIFNFLKEFFNFFIPFINFSYNFADIIVDVLNYLYYFVRGLLFP